MLYEVKFTESGKRLYSGYSESYARKMMQKYAGRVWMYSIPVKSRGTQA